jgi:formylglycine-generating enzyme required for sulfatase activity
MKPAEAAQRLSAFERDHGPELVGLASHAALPVVLNAEALHLLRINYFLDPPHLLPYTAEASLLLSSLCTVIDDGFYVIAPELRDLLLKRLIKDYGGERVRDVARLLWEYSDRRAPWAQRPGLTEAQQLTALNFIDHTRALNWLLRARRGEGSVPVDDDRWFVFLEQDLQDRAAAVEKAEGEAIFLGAKLPALTALRDALMKEYGHPGSALEVARTLGLELPAVPEHAGASRVWQAVLDAAWISNRMPDVLRAVPKLGTQALNEYWFRLSPALRVEHGRFQDPPPEWQILEQQRAVLEAALRALVLMVFEEPSHEPKIVGMGALVGDYAVLTHKSMSPGHSRYEMVAGSRLFAELASDHPTLAPGPVSTRLELTLAGIEEHTELAVFISDPDQDRSGFPEPLTVMTEVPPAIKGRKVCVMGYPVKDHLIPESILSRVMADTYAVLRFQPGEILDEDLEKGLLIHNCFTAGGNGGSPLIDIQTAQVLGIHFRAQFQPGPTGFKQGNAISTFRLVNHPLLVEAGVFRTPLRARPPRGEDWPRLMRPERHGIFVNRWAEQNHFLDLLKDPRGGVLVVTGDPGIGKTALLRRFQRLAEEHGRPTVFLSVSSLTRDWSLEQIYDEVAVRLGLGPFPSRIGGERDEARIERSLERALREQRSVLFFDDVGEDILRQMRDFILSVDTSLTVIATRSSELFRQIYDASMVRMLHLGPLDPSVLREWFAAEGLEPRDEIVKLLERGSDLKPSRLAELIHALRPYLAGLAKPAPPTGSGASERLPSVEVPRPWTGVIVYHDDAEERFGPFVATRGSHGISIPDRYRIGVSPVNNALFSEFVQAGGYRHGEFWRSVTSSTRAGFVSQDGMPGPANWGSATTPSEFPNHPVAGICYHEAVAFVAWLERAVAPFEGMRWCIPAEDMWEFAARGPSGFLYPWGPESALGRCNSREVNIGAPSPPGRFPDGRSVFGAEDMAANVWEFVRASDQEPWACVLRGGSYLNTIDEVKSSLRLFAVPRDHRPPDFGLRCALEPAAA